VAEVNKNMQTDTNSKNDHNSFSLSPIIQYVKIPNSADPATIKQFDAAVFEQNPSLTSFIRPCFPCELPWGSNDSEISSRWKHWKIVESFGGSISSLPFGLPVEETPETIISLFEKQQSFVELFNGGRLDESIFPNVYEKCSDGEIPIRHLLTHDRWDF
jgi:hypothetical protein